MALIIEAAGSKDFFGGSSGQAQGQLVGVYVRPEHRGTELIGGNQRARAAYLKLGFAPTGAGVPAQDDPLLREVELAIARP
ncbi:hypothetical protein [Streptomyces sp. NPDC091212]|uniref:hypothetical protein n=1 Tax=Streptomyces sp. NPDC091212 TaxID=3155191 RepID=UPI00343E7E2D